ncbi:hypothetical protein DWB98_13430 (plasmid) [Staphylococcus xylosus]|uniref:hypothetical protein n=1 Tax=Staphylococcus xylosus TaxID=1288 RepID=UPI001187F596|nr:hypothetical protein [Staphylococcus xylosus]QDW90444.1 hypothetical protein DWB98_13430 [Staphylococcus xylosus]
MKLNDLYFNDLEIISAITLQYADDIECKLLIEKGEVLQEDFTKITYQLFCEYIKLKTDSSLLDLVNKKYLKIIEENF